MSHHLSTVYVVSRDKLRVNAVANTLVAEEDVRHTKSELQDPLSKEFTNTALTSEQQTAVLVCKISSRFLLSMSELGQCTALTPMRRPSSINVLMRCENGA